MDPDVATFLQVLQIVDPLQFGHFDPSKPLDSDSYSDSQSEDATREVTGYPPMIFNLSHLTPEERLRVTNISDSEKDVSDSKEEEAPKEADTMSNHRDKIVNGAWISTGLKQGEISKAGEDFCLWEIVCKYPENFVGKRNGEKCAPLWNKEGLTGDYVWDLYYMYDPNNPDKKPILFVPTYQFEHFLDIVNRKISAYLCIPEGTNGRGFHIKFGNQSLRPRFLGRSTTREDFDDLIDEYPDPHPSDDVDKFAREDKDALLELFKKLVKWGAISRGKSKKNNQMKRIHAHQAWGRAVRRVQRYLGLPKANGPGPRSSPLSFDVNKPMAAKPEGSVLLIAIDLEAYEHNQSIISEVGLAILDTAKLVGVAPGEGGKNWFDLIEARHIRIEENRWVTNRSYVQGCPQNFNFGKSEFVCLNDVPRLLEQVIDDAKVPETGEPRNVALVFHDKGGDIKYLKELRYNPFAATNVIELIDTREMDQVVRRSTNQAGLAAVLDRLGIDAWNLHNAGNDAVYTMRAMVGLAISKCLSSIKRRAAGNDNGNVTWAEFQEKEGWTSDEDTDGGDAGPLFVTEEDMQGLGRDMEGVVVDPAAQREWF